jgi:ATP-dependent DNA helicase DinG
VDDLLKNFPFPNLRERQSYVLNEIATALASGYRYIILEAPTGFGKSPVAIAVALTLGTSYICTSTKDLQTQYARDFHFVRVAKGKNNYTCAVKDDFIRNGTYRCGLCVSRINECYHTTVDYGPCMTNESFKDSGGIYRTFPRHYTIINKGTREEKVFIDEDTKNHYQKEYSQWSHLKNLRDQRGSWMPCEYFHQLNIALAASHSVFNYSMLLSLLPTKKFPSRELLILDEAHLLEKEIVGFTGISISKRWKRYLPNFKIVDYGYEIEKWINFLIELRTQMLDLTGNVSEELAVEAITDTQKLTRAINDIRSNPKNWIVSEIKKENNEVTGVQLKPLDVSPYCKGVFEKCDKTLMMSATILESKTFCQSYSRTC